MEIYRVTVVPAVGPDTGKNIDAVLLGVAYNPTSNKFQLLLAGVDDNANALRMVANDQLSKLIIRGPIK